MKLVHGNTSTKDTSNVDIHIYSLKEPHCTAYFKVQLGSYVK